MAVVYILLILIGLLLVVLFLPWRFGVCGSILSSESQNDYSGAAVIGTSHTGLQVVFGSPVSIGIGPYKKPWFTWSMKEKSPKPKKTKPKTQKITEKEKPKKKVNWIRLTKKLVPAIFRRIHWQRAEVEGTVGFRNTMNTGLVHGILSTIKPWLPNHGSAIKISTSFKPQYLIDLEGELILSLNPGVLAITAGWVYIRNK